VRCGICERRVDHDRDPYYLTTHPGHYDDERFEVAMANHLFVRACWSCFMRWPTNHKRRGGCMTEPELAELVEILGAAA
jgi:hypothetical protein